MQSWDRPTCRGFCPWSWHHTTVAAFVHLGKLLSIVAVHVDRGYGGTSESFSRARRVRLVGSQARVSYDDGRHRLSGEGSGEGPTIKLIKRN